MTKLRFARLGCDTSRRGVPLVRRCGSSVACLMTTLMLLAALSPVLLVPALTAAAPSPASSSSLSSKTTSWEPNCGPCLDLESSRGNLDPHDCLAKSSPTGIAAIIAGRTGSRSRFAVSLELTSEIASQAGEMRQLDCQAVPVNLVNRDELRGMLLEDFEEDSEEIDTTQGLLVLLDLLDEGNNLRDILVEAYTQDVLGFYDPEKGELYLVSDTGELTPLDKLTLAHEYTHAIQDQHFDLSSLDERSGDSEASIAIQALIEGDATVVMWLYSYYYLSSEERAAIGEASAAEPGMGDDVPEVIRKTMVFPYEYGMQFVLALVQEGKWEAVNDAYNDPPKSTEQIMHPEKYIQDRDDPVVVTLPDMAKALGHGWSELDSDVFGEFSLELYLEAFLSSSEAERAAAGWGGDRYSFLEDGAGRKAFVLESEWDTEDDATAFYEACTDRARAKGGSGELGSAKEGRASGEWESEGLSYRFELDEESVHLVIAPDAKTADKAMATLSGLGKSSNVWIYVGAAVGLACLICILGLVALLLRRRRSMRSATGSVISEGDPNP